MQSVVKITMWKNINIAEIHLLVTANENFGYLTNYTEYMIEMLVKKYLQTTTKYRAPTIITRCLLKINLELINTFDLKKVAL